MRHPSWSRWPRTVVLVSLMALVSSVLVSFQDQTGPGQDQAAPGSPGSRPNVVVIMTDDLDMRSTQAMLDAGLMPNLRQHLIDRGVTFRNSFVTDPLCCPSRATYLTGQYPHNHRVFGNLFPTGGHGILWWDLYGDGELDGDFEGEQSTLPVWLQQAGYHTGFVGKYLNGYGTDTPVDHVPHGWDDWQGLVGGSTYCVYDYKLYDSQQDILFTYGQNGSITQARGGQILAVDQAADWRDNYQTDVLAQRSVEFLRDATQGTAPFFLSITPLAPHYEACLVSQEPGQGFDALWHMTIRPAPRHANLDVIPDLPIASILAFNEADLTDKPRWLWEETHQKYRPALDEPSIQAVRAQWKDRLGSLRAVDDLIGRVVDELAASGQLENTAILFTSDNGWLYGEHRLSQKIFAYEEAIRVPLYVRAPGAGQPGTRDGMVLNNDLAPTIMELAGATAPMDFAVDGRSFAALLGPEGEPAWPRKRFLIEHWYTRETLAQVPTYHAIRAETTLYVRWKDEYSSGEFYPRLDQPGGAAQMHNYFADLAPDVRGKLDTLIASFVRCSGATCRGLEDR